MRLADDLAPPLTEEELGALRAVTFRSGMQFFFARQERATVQCESDEVLQFPAMLELNPARKVERYIVRSVLQGVFDPQVNRVRAMMADMVVLEQKPDQKKATLPVLAIFSREVGLKSRGMLPERGVLTSYLIRETDRESREARAISNVITVPFFRSPSPTKP